MRASLQSNLPVRAGRHHDNQECRRVNLWGAPLTYTIPSFWRGGRGAQAAGLRPTVWDLVFETHGMYDVLDGATFSKFERAGGLTR